MVVREKARATLRPLVAAFVADRYADVATDGVQVVALAQELLRQAGLILFAEDYPNVTMADTAACSVWFERACGATEPPSQAAESFGVRTLRELIAALRPVPGVGVVGPAPGAVVVPTAADLTTWIGALAEARSLGLDDVVAGIEAKLRAIGALADAAVAPPAPPYAVFDEAPPLDDPAAPVPGAAWDPNDDPPF